LVYADNVNVLDGMVHTVKINTETLVVVSKESRVVVNADTTKYVVMSRDQNEGRNHNMKTDNLFLKRVEVFKYLGTNVTNQNFIQEEIKSRLKSGNACYHSVQNFLSSIVLSKI
jgi:ribosomal protein L30E